MIWIAKHLQLSSIEVPEVGPTCEWVHSVLNRRFVTYICQILGVTTLSFVGVAVCCGVTVLRSYIISATERFGVLLPICWSEIIFLRWRYEATRPTIPMMCNMMILIDKMAYGIFYYFVHFA